MSSQSHLQAVSADHRAGETPPSPSPGFGAGATGLPRHYCVEHRPLHPPHAAPPTPIAGTYPERTSSDIRGLLTPSSAAACSQREEPGGCGGGHRGGAVGDGEAERTWELTFGHGASPALRLSTAEGRVEAGHPETEPPPDHECPGAGPTAGEPGLSRTAGRAGARPAPGNERATTVIALATQIPYRVLQLVSALGAPAAHVRRHRDHEGSDTENGAEVFVNTQLRRIPRASAMLRRCPDTLLLLLVCSPSPWPVLRGASWSRVPIQNSFGRPATRSRAAASGACSPAQSRSVAGSPGSEPATSTGLPACPTLPRRRGRDSGAARESSGARRPRQASFCRTRRSP